MLTPMHYTSIIITLVVVSGMGIYSAKFVRTDTDFTVGGRKMGPLLVVGSLVGSFIGGTSTVGSAQMAFKYGLSGMWFTLGGGLSCILMALLLAGPLREKRVETVSQFLAVTYGENVAPWVAVYTSAGIFIQIGAQVLAAIPLLAIIFGLDPFRAAVAAVGLIVLYVIAGGFWAASMVGLIKLILIYLSMLVAGIMSLYFLGGLDGMREALPLKPYLTLFPRGIGKELASVFSVIIGFSSTQTYLQPLFAASSVKSARRGLFLGATMIPVIGFAAVLVGMFMRARHPELNAASALPQFIFDYMPPWLGGVTVATLLISLVLSGAALSLGISTVMARDVYSRFRPKAKGKEMLLVSRGLVFLVGLGVLVMVTANIQSLILHWAFLSMALRGVTVFVPLVAAIFLAHRVNPFWGRIAVIVAPLLTISWAFAFPGGIDPLYVGLLISVGIMVGGSMMKGTRDELNVSGCPRDIR